MIDNVSLGIDSLKRVVDERCTEKITLYTDPVDVCTLSNGIQVGRLSTQTTSPYGYAMLLIGDLSVNPIGRYGKALMQRFYACLNAKDKEIVVRIALKVQKERVFATGNRR